MTVKDVLVIFGVIEVGHLAAKVAYRMGKRAGKNEAIDTLNGTQNSAEDILRRWYEVHPEDFKLVKDK